MVSRLIKKNVTDKALLQWFGKKDFKEQSKTRLLKRLDEDLNSYNYGISVQRHLADLNPTALKSKK